MRYISPSDLETALSNLVEYKGKIIAGGTDVFPASGQGARPRNILDVTNIPALRGVSQTGGEIRIGAATTWSEIVRSELPQAFEGLKQAARQVGSIQIQNSGTIGGNICNASPAADGVPALLALNAKVELASANQGVRFMPLSDFILGVRKTALRPDEILTSILVPGLSPNAGSSFRKLGSREYLVISIVMVAAVIECAENGRVVDARVAVGSCSPVAKRLGLLESELIGQRPQEFEVTSHHLAELSPIDDIRGSAAYRLEAVAELCGRAIVEAARHG